MYKEILFLSLLLIIAGTFCNAELPTAVEALKGSLLYENTYDNASSLDEITAEGPMDAEIRSGRLHMASFGGHFTTWYHTVDHPDNFIIEWEFTPVEAKGLCILFTCAKGLNGEDIFDSSLPARNGSYSQYHSGSINNYGLSYYRNNRSYSDSVNLRRNKGFKMVKAVTPNPIPLPPACVSNTYHLVWVKNGPIIRWYVDGYKTLEWIDSNPYGSGKFGLRQMSATVAEYDNLRLWAIGTTDIRLGNGGRSEQGGISCYPNPFNTITSIVISNQLSVNGGKVEIMDITGKLLHTIPIADNRSPITGLQWQGRGQSNGVYMIRVNTGDRILSKKVVLNR
jgi:hypothetical protein